jgi:hypothetical protein
MDKRTKLSITKNENDDNDPDDISKGFSHALIGWIDRRAAVRKMDALREKLSELRRTLREATAHLRSARCDWQEAQRVAQAGKIRHA